jgi:hypothetical protein
VPHDGSGADKRLLKLLPALKVPLEGTLDPFCVVNGANEIVHMDLAMRVLLGLSGRDVSKKLVFCDVLKLSACESSCQIEQVIRSGLPLRQDEQPATRLSRKLRVTLKATPIPDPADPKQILGAIIVVRDTSAEVLLHAKYHKMLELLKDKDLQMGEQAAQLRKLQDTLRRARRVA